MIQNIAGLEALDPDELDALRDNLAACRNLEGLHKNRAVPESMCIEIERVLRLFEADTRSREAVPLLQ